MGFIQLFAYLGDLHAHFLVLALIVVLVSLQGSQEPILVLQQAHQVDAASAFS